jgi:hypothetical protein
MAETANEIRDQIEDTRAQIGNTLAELEHKVSPRRIVDDHPLALLGAAFGAGLILSAVTRRGRSDAHATEDPDMRPGRMRRTASGAVGGLANAIMTAAVGTFVSRVATVLEDGLSNAEPDYDPVSTDDHAA